MAGRRIPYLLADGSEVPGVTTIIGKFRDPGPLMYWAWAEGKAGRDYRTTRDAAADSGTLAHAMVEAEIRGQPWVDPVGADPAVLARAKQAYQNYEQWRVQTNLTPIESEKRLVSERYRFGGTLDAMLISGQLSLGDWKTSSAVYADYLIQLAAYGLLWEENFPDRPVSGGYHLLRFAKETSDFAHHHFGDLTDAARAFLLMRDLYEIDKTLRKRVK